MSITNDEIDWSWLENDENIKILRTLKNIYAIECQTINGRKVCHLYTEKGFKRLIKKPELVEDIDYIDINGKSDYTIRNYISAEHFIINGKTLITPTDFFIFIGNGNLECKIADEKGNKLLYCVERKK